MSHNPIIKINPLGFVWETNDPFLFCVNHLDEYPAGNEQMGPAASLEGRNIGQDFTLKDGWRMYHGDKIPGFPAHPHRGFETVTIVLRGLIDHSDSHGAAGRYGDGDVQWMTAGAGLQHSEMFPLIDQKNPNTIELFQIWLNLPRAKKFVQPYYTMLWAEDIPVISEKDMNGRSTEITVIAGKISNVSALPPAPDSWAADPKNEVGIWLIRMEANGKWTIPPAISEVKRSLYFYKGLDIRISGSTISPAQGITLEPNHPCLIENGDHESFLLILQGKPIDEPVAQHGPFVMNTAAEIQQAYTDFRKTQFGVWPWPRFDNVHPREKGRFSKYADGREEIR